MTESLVYYTGKVRHTRYHHKNHQFTYRLCMFYFDVSKIDQTFKNRRGISLEKFNWYSFRRRDYLNGHPSSLDQEARSLVEKNCGFYPKGKIYLLTQLSCLGYCFNPMSVYFVFKEHTDEIEAVIVEVTNTPWSEKHRYIKKISQQQTKKGCYTCSFKKELHVSPFLDMDYEYQFYFKVTTEKIIVHINNMKNNKKHFDATLLLQAQHLTPAQGYSFLLKYPVMTYKVSAAIYWQAFKLWIKGVKFHSHPRKKSIS